MLNFIDPEVASGEKSTETIEMRIKPSVKNGIVRAAELMGVSVTSFMRASAVREAERVLREHQATLLTAREHRIVLDALDSPPPPSQAALDAATRYRKRISRVD